VTVREQIENAGRAPLLGWIESRKDIDVQKTDIRLTFRKVRRIMERNKRSEA
jgi:hypothetical protein